MFSRYFYDKYLLIYEFFIVFKDQTYGTLSHETSSNNNHRVSAFC